MLSHKYIKRTGTPGHYRYWYKDPKTGALYEGLNAPKNSPHHDANKPPHNNKPKGYQKVVMVKKKGPKVITAKIKNPIKGPGYKDIKQAPHIDFYNHIFTAHSDNNNITTEHMEEVLTERFKSKYGIKNFTIKTEDGNVNHNTIIHSCREMEKCFDFASDVFGRTPFAKNIKSVVIDYTNKDGFLGLYSKAENSFILTKEGMNTVFDNATLYNELIFHELTHAFETTPAGEEIHNYVDNMGIFIPGLRESGDISGNIKSLTYFSPQVGSYIGVEEVMQLINRQEDYANGQEDKVLNDFRNQIEQDKNKYEEALRNNPAQEEPLYSYSGIDTKECVAEHMAWLLNSMKKSPKLDFSDPKTIETMKNFYGRQNPKNRDQWNRSLDLIQKMAISLKKNGGVK